MNFLNPADTRFSMKSPLNDLTLLTNLANYKSSYSFIDAYNNAKQVLDNQNLRQALLANKSAQSQNINNLSNSRPINWLELPKKQASPSLEKKGLTPEERKEGLRKAFHPEEFIKKTAYDNKGKSVEEVKALQKRLGVSVDGKWGANTQKAYEALVSKQKEASLKENVENRELTRIAPKTSGVDTKKLATKWLPGDYLKKGGKVEEKKEGGKNWIQKAVNPEHKGYCTPMTKSTCTPRRKAFAMTMKKHHGFHKADGGEMPKSGDQAAVYKKGDKVKQMGGQIYGAAKKGTKIDASKWKKSK